MHFIKVNFIGKEIKEIFSEKEVIGADVVEFSPKENFYAEAFSLAKLCYKLMALKLR